MNDFTYNQLLKSPEFWKTFVDHGVEKVLCFQVDTLLLRPGIERFLMWDYIGAPWTKSNDIYSGVNEQGVKIPKLPADSRCCNGGLSLRSVKGMVDVVAKYGGSSGGDEQEDVFFVRHLTVMGFRVADPGSARWFSVEVPTGDILRNPRPDLPSKPEGGNELFGLHQTYKFMEREALLELVLGSLHVLSEQVGHRQTKEARIRERRELDIKSKLLEGFGVANTAS